MTSEQFINKAKQTINEKVGVSINSIHLVWFAKTLQNFKALLVDIETMQVYEFIFNGAKQEFYLDVYVKKENYLIKEV